MEARTFLEVLTVAERLKDATRHSYTSKGRHESVAEHSWRTVLMAYFLHDEFPKADMDKVMKMCLIHDLGEAFTGDIPVFEKTKADEEREDELLNEWVQTLPKPYAEEMSKLYQEMNEMQTLEAKIYKAIDSMEAVISHNDADIKTWTPNEYELNVNYAFDRVAFSEYLTNLRNEIQKDTLKKIEGAKENDTERTYAGRIDL